MMDTYYKQAYKLWQLLGKTEEVAEFSEKQVIENEYFVYCEMLFLFSLHFFNFRANGNTHALLRDEKFQNASFSFCNWKITLNTQNDDFFGQTFSATVEKKEIFPVSFDGISLPESHLYAEFDVTKSKDTLSFSRKLSDVEQRKLADGLVQNIDKNKENWKNQFLRTLHDGLEKFNVQKRRIIFAPWKYTFADDMENLKSKVGELKQHLPTDNEERYVLTLCRPNDFSNVENAEVLQELDSYCNGNVDSKEDTMGIVPISINDINSFRRFTKILLKNMILVDTEHKNCPICGKKMRLDGGVYQCYDCKLKIIETKCPKCRKKYLYTDYELPKTLDIKSDSVGMNILLKENERGFKNITELAVENAKIAKPICPYCCN